MLLCLVCLISLAYDSFGYRNTRGSDPTQHNAGPAFVGSDSRSHKRWLEGDGWYTTW